MSYILRWGLFKSCTNKMFQYQHQYLQLLSTPAQAELLQLQKTLNGFAKSLVTYPMSSLTLFAIVLQEFTTWTLLFFYTGTINKGPVYHCYRERFSLLTEIDKEMSISSVLTNNRKFCPMPSCVKEI